MTPDTTDVNFLNDADLAAEEERIIRDYNETFPLKGDRLFVETQRGIHLDPLGMTNWQTGERSSTGRRELYANGYREAADRLVDSLTGAPWEDSLIYPILYLYRHHLELELKVLVAYSVRNFSKLETTALERKLDELKKTHNLGSLWDQLRHYYPRWNEGSSAEAQQAFNSLLQELIQQDPNGEAGRYEVDVRGNQTLPGLAVVDAGTFKAGIHKISNYLRTISVGIDLELEGQW